MADVKDAFEHNGFKVTIAFEEGSYVGWMARLDGKITRAGLGMGNRISTHHYQERQQAVDAAKRAIDTGEADVSGVFKIRKCDRAYLVGQENL